MSRRNREKRQQDRNDQAMAVRQRQQLISASWTGPLPPPDALQSYNDALPNGAERIVALVERQSEHRMKLEEKVIDADITRSKWGLFAGVVIALAGLAATFFIADRGEPWAAAIIGAADLATLAGVFVYGTAMRRAERDQRRKQARGG